MQTFNLDTLTNLVENKFHLVLALVDRVQLLKRGVEAKVPRKGRDLITVAMDEMSRDLLSFEVKDTKAETTLITHKSEKPSEVDPSVAREEALAAANAALGFGIDRRTLTPTPGKPMPKDLEDDDDEELVKETLVAEEVDEDEAEGEPAEEGKEEGA
jgi:DNA-directed RNA polymerase subunit K/omega